MSQKSIEHIGTRLDLLPCIGINLRRQGSLEAILGKLLLENERAERNPLLDLFQLLIRSTQIGFCRVASRNFVTGCLTSDVTGGLLLPLFLAASKPQSGSAV